MKTDIEIAQEANPENVAAIAAKLGLSADDVECYGKYKAKLPLTIMERKGKEGKLVLVTAITPTPAGEGKTTTTIGLADGLKRIGKKVVVALREPSLGPVFGIKGGAAGGGYAQVIPMEDINLHFTGDFHAIGAANNLLAAMIDNHIFQGNELGIDTVVWRRCVDMNDRQLRFVRDGLGGPKDGVPRDDGYDITVASEIMAILCLATSLTDLKARLARIVVGYTKDGTPVTAGDLKAQGAMCALLKDAMKPNLVQTLEGTPAIVHGGPFANIAHGCNSVAATKTALKLGDYIITEAGFGADLGAEKFIDIKCRAAGISPKAIVLVATVRALKFNGGAYKSTLDREDLDALSKGICNLTGHIRNLRDVFGASVVVAINKFITDTDAEIDYIKDVCIKQGADFAVCECWAKGGEGSIELARSVIAAVDKGGKVNYAYTDDMSIKEKIEALAVKVYGADGVEYTPKARSAIAAAERQGKGKLPVCIAKTQYSFSDDQTKLGRPTGFKITVSDVEIRSGAGFLVAVCGSMMLMPGLGKRPAAMGMAIDSDSYEIKGLF